MVNTDQSKIQVLSALVARMALANQLGTQQYGGDRDIYQALGYMTDIKFSDYFGRYIRQDIAKAIIDRPVAVTWRGDIRIMESKESEDTPLEKAWVDLDRLLGLKSRLARLDRLTGIGKYGVLLLGLNDVQQTEDFVKPVTGGTKKLLYVKPLSSESAQILEYETDPSNERYGLPTIYSITIQEMENGSSRTIRVHYSRVIHIVDDILESEVEGNPRLEVVFNRLMDLEKLVGGDAEMFWRGARPGYAGKLDKDYQITTATMEDLQDQIDEYEHNLRRILVNEGLDLQSLAQQIADPATHVDIQIQMISAVTGIPKRILTGSERGELASTQDKSEWLEFVQTRRDEYAEPRILRPLIDKLIELGVLPKAGEEGYTILWSDLFAMSKKDKVEIGRTRTEALRAYASQPMTEAIVSPEAFFQFFLGLDEDEINLIEEMRDSEISNEVREQMQESKQEQLDQQKEMFESKAGTNPFQKGVKPGEQKKPEGKPPAKKPNTNEEVDDYGGPGSGNFDHAGRPGKVGGSGSGLGRTSDDQYNIIGQRHYDRYLARRTDRPHHIHPDTGQEMEWLEYGHPIWGVVGVWAPVGPLSGEGAGKKISDDPGEKKKAEDDTKKGVYPWREKFKEANKDYKKSDWMTADQAIKYAEANGWIVNWIRGAEGWERSIPGFDLRRYDQEMTEILDKYGITGARKTLTISDSRVEIQISQGFGDEKFNIRRSFIGKTAYHEYFNVPDSIRSAGMSKAIMRTHFRQYLHAGIENISVHANINVGGYTWARYGFRTSVNQAELLVRYSRKLTTAQKKIANGIIARYQKKTGSSFIPMSLLSDTSFGKDLLLGTDWQGSIDLTVKSEYYRFFNYMNGYIKSRKK